MKRTLLMTAVSAMLFGMAAMPAAAAEVRTFLPENDLKIPVDSPYARGIMEAQFNEVLDIVERIYKPIVAARGKVLEVKRLWTDATVNAYAQQSGNRYIISMFGGLARHETITMDGFALVACHELGHHLAGAPKVSGWASNEGQSDYYSSLKCLRKVYEDSASANFTRLSEGDEVAIAACESVYSDAGGQAACVRSAMAGKSVAYLFKALRNETVIPRFDTPDRTVVATMYQKHPGTQCRMDTYLAGALCAQPFESVLSETDPVPGTCTRSTGWLAGFRPLCWYKPAKDSELLPLAAKVPSFDEAVSRPALGPAYGVLQRGFPIR